MPRSFPAREEQEGSRTIAEGQRKAQHRNTPLPPSYPSPCVLGRPRLCSRKGQGRDKSQPCVRFPMARGLQARRPWGAGSSSPSLPRADVLPMQQGLCWGREQTQAARAAAGALNGAGTHPSCPPVKENQGGLVPPLGCARLPPSQRPRAQPSAPVVVPSPAAPSTCTSPSHPRSLFPPLQALIHADLRGSAAELPPGASPSALLRLLLFIFSLGQWQTLLSECSWGAPSPPCRFLPCLAPHPLGAAEEEIQTVCLPP